MIAIPLLLASAASAGAGAAAVGMGAAAGGMIAGGVSAIAFSAVSMMATSFLGLNKRESQKITGGQDLRLTGASEGAPISIPFGEVSMIGNIIRYERRTVRNEKITEKIPGGFLGLGSEKITIGRKDFCSFELGIGVGPIDAVVQIINENTGENILPRPILFTDSEDHKNVYLKGPKGRVAGNVTIYRGSYTQTRQGDEYSGDGWNGRGITFAVFKNFLVGDTSPEGPGVNIPSFSFVVRRYPEARNLPEGMFRTGSTDPESPSNYDANPAAIFWESAVNEEWGLGLDPSFLDAPSFVRCSQFLAEQSLGMSFEIDQQMALDDIKAAISDSTKALITDDGVKIYMRAAEDTSLYYGEGNIHHINAEDLKSVSGERQTKATSYSEVRVNYTNRDANWKVGSLTRKNLYSVGTGSVLTVTLGGISNSYTASLMAEKLIDEIESPKASYSLVGGQSLSNINAGDVIAVTWQGYDEDLPVTVYVTAAVIEEDPESGEISIQALESSMRGPDYTDEVEYGAPEPIVNRIVGYNNDELDPSTEILNYAEEVEEMKLFEVPPQLTRIKPQGIVALWAAPVYADAADYYLADGEAEFSFRGTLYNPSIVLFLTEDLPIDDPIMTDDIIVTMYNDEELDEFIAGSQHIESVDDNDIQDLVNAQVSYGVIGNEIIQIGWSYSEVVVIGEFGAEEEVTILRIRNIVRGMFGTLIEPHLAGDKIYWITNLDAFDSAVSGFATGAELSVKLLSKNLFGSNDLGVTKTIEYTNKGVRPQSAILDSFDGVNLSIWPRLVLQGTGITDDVVLSIGTLEFMVQEVNGVGQLVGEEYKLDGTFVPALNGERGSYQAALNIDPTTTELRIWTVDISVRSPDYLTISV